MFDFTNYSDLDAFYMIDYINMPARYPPRGVHRGGSLRSLYKHVGSLSPRGVHGGGLRLLYKHASPASTRGAHRGGALRLLYKYANPASQLGVCWGGNLRRLYKHVVFRGWRGMPALRCSIPIGPASRDVRCGRGWKLKLGNMLLLKGRRSVWNAMGEVNVYINISRACIGCW